MLGLRTYLHIAAPFSPARFITGAADSQGGLAFCGALLLPLLPARPPPPQHLSMSATVLQYS
jgi:hypothetical protein